MKGSGALPGGSDSGEGGRRLGGRGPGGGMVTGSGSSAGGGGDAGCGCSSGGERLDRPARSSNSPIPVPTSGALGAADGRTARFCFLLLATDPV